MWRADQFATLGRTAEATHDIDRAATWLDRPHSSPAGFFSRETYGYGIANHLAAVQGLTAGLDGRQHAAEAGLAVALDEAPNGRRLAANHAHVSLTHVAMGDADAAAASLTDAVRLSDEAGYGMGVRRAVGVRAAFPAEWSGVDEVAELDAVLVAASEPT